MGRLRTFLLVLVVFLDFYCKTCESAKGFGPGEQDWGFLDVREGAHMFYWLYYTTANVSSYTQRPLVIWMVGGPGSSSAGYGNLFEIGPLTLQEEERNFTWVKYTNLLFIDSPVGSGYSYVDDESLLTTTNNQIALDFLSFMKAFYVKHSEFESVPLHLFGESYGSKMIAEIALELYRAIERGELGSNLKSVTMMSAGIAPVESKMALAPYLLSMGVIDIDGYEATMKEARKYEDLVSAGNWREASEQSDNITLIAYKSAKGVNSFNILRKLPVINDAESVPAFNGDSDAILEELMNGKVAKALNVNSTWGPEALVKSYLIADLELPVVDIIIELLESTELEVGIVTAQLDLVCGALGFVEFMKNMNWAGKADYEAAPREGFSVDGVLEGYTKSAGKFTFFWINRAGHMISHDNPAALNYVLKYVTKYNEDSPYIASFL